MFWFTVPKVRPDPIGDLPAAWERTGKSGHLIALIKPQFEATRAEADKAQGISQDPVIHARVVDGLTAAIQSLRGA
jgi:23S rRNA (cytidine1920-2'-O)/16S rRNA (cytidine1409-2'-O)-methyltransferase